MSTEDVNLSLPSGRPIMDEKFTTSPTNKRKRDSITGELDASRKAPRRDSSHVAEAISYSPPLGRQPQDDPNFFKLDTPDSSQREMTAAQAIQQAEAILSDEHVTDPGNFRPANRTMEEEAANHAVEGLRQGPPEGDQNLTQGDFLRPQPIGATNGAKEKKPAVGSDEWHRSRKDSHKEGKSYQRLYGKAILTIYSRAKTPRNNQRRHHRHLQPPPAAKREEQRSNPPKRCRVYQTHRKREEQYAR